MGRLVQKKRSLLEGMRARKKERRRGFSYLAPQAFNALCMFLDAAPQALNQRAGIGEPQTSGALGVWSALPTK